MAFEKGMKKVKGSGRKKGQKNRKTLLKLEETLIQSNFNPIEQLLKIYGELEAKDKVSVCFDLMRYLEPKLKDVGPEDMAIKQEAVASPLASKSTEALVKLLKKGS